MFGAHFRCTLHSLLKITPLEFCKLLIRHAASIDILLRDGGHSLLTGLEGFGPQHLLAGQESTLDIWVANEGTRINGIAHVTGLELLTSLLLA